VGERGLTPFQQRPSTLRWGDGRSVVRAEVFEHFRHEEARADEAEKTEQECPSRPVRKETGGSRDRKCGGQWQGESHHGSFCHSRQT
jgi:hypothetical protein